ncbi:flagellar biosynthesis regulator FlaF [Thalassospiraceae bacterium LMO-SO8]|nr:flagellar biosynthesis regulator FlaF [Alphaproteobacteria bacterium LMO-S08]WND74988.1 flagellar biosynthesis regulator FlaF [Thalassospiraceae bacterium LMO-SO8]
MPPYKNQVQKYERRPVGGNPAQTEAWALIEAAKRMAASIIDDNLDPKTMKDARKAALRLNWRLWTIFQSELTLEHSEVPSDLRINMLTLCKFVDKHTVGALAKPTPEALAVLIDINRNIAAGLAQVPENAGKETEAAPAEQLGNAQAPDEPSASPPQSGSKPIDLDV